MTVINYKKVIADLEFQNDLTLLQISLEILSEQYIALLEYFSLLRDIRCGLMFDQMTDYFYANRAGFILGK